MITKLFINGEEILGFVGQDDWTDEFKSAVARSVKNEPTGMFSYVDLRLKSGKIVTGPIMSKDVFSTQTIADKQRITFIK